MENLYIIMGGLTAIILFIFGLENFSAEIQQLAGENFRRFLARATSIPVVGLLIGALVTAIIQSSSATSVIAVSLVNAGVLSFKNSVSIIFGANVGTTVTAQLVAFKLTSFAPLLIVLGFMISLLRSRFAIFGKSIFYIGFVFFALNLISSALQPLQQSPALVQYLTEAHNPFYSILVGLVFTAIVQSSSVTTGVVIIFAQQGLLGLDNAVPIILGANIGTTATVLLSIIRMDLAAKKTAVSHLLFNVGGVALFLPLYLLFGDHLNDLHADPAVALAAIHFVFNMGTSVVFILFLGPFTRFIDRLLGEGKMDFVRLGIPTLAPGTDFDTMKSDLQRKLGDLLGFLQENYNQVTLSIESNYQSVFEASARRLEYVNFLEQEYMGYFSKVVATVTDENESRQLLRLVTRYDYLFQIHDSIRDLFNTKQMMNRHYIELKSDILLMVRELSSETLTLFDEINSALAEERRYEVSGRARELRATLEQINHRLLSLLAHPDRRDAGAMSNLVTYSRRLTDKLLNFAALATVPTDHTGTTEQMALQEASITAPQ